MSQKKYQIFLSSTYEDLKDERRAVEEVIVRAGDLPVGMEAFPAADDEQFEFIKTIIDRCDYYVLIIAGRYGSLSRDGLSFTEKEYRHAVEKGVPVLVLLRDGRDKISADKVEADSIGRERLEAFISLVSRDRIRKTWNTIDGLKLAVREAIDHAKATKPRPGWVRGDTVASVETLEMLAKLQRDHDSLVARLGRPRIAITQPDLPDPAQAVNLTLISHRTHGVVVVSVAWIDAFPFFFRGLAQRRTNYNGEDYHYYDLPDSLSGIGRAIESAVKGDTSNRFKLSEDSFKLLESYYMEAGLILPGGEYDMFPEESSRLARRLFVASAVNSCPFSVLKGEFEEDDIPF